MYEYFLTLFMQSLNNIKIKTGIISLNILFNIAGGSPVSSLKIIIGKHFILYIHIKIVSFI